MACGLLKMFMLFSLSTKILKRKIEENKTISFFVCIDERYVPKTENTRNKYANKNGGLIKLNCREHYETHKISEWISEKFENEKQRKEKRSTGNSNMNYISLR